MNNMRVSTWIRRIGPAAQAEDSGGRSGFRWFWEQGCWRLRSAAHASEAVALPTFTSSEMGLICVRPGVGS